MLNKVETKKKIDTKPLASYFSSSMANEDA